MSYSIYSFMCEELSLGGGELLIFAVIYSFSRGNLGIYHGTQDYLSRISGLSVSTVKRALKALLKKGYIEKVSLDEHEGYRSTKQAAADEPKAEECPPNDAENSLPSSFEIDKAGLDVRELLNDKATRPKYAFHSVGKEELVHMTAEQYKRLSRLVGSDKLSAYIHRLELLIRDSGYRTHSPYKTIKKWIYEDTAV